MGFKASDIMKRASTILQDAGAVRWTAVELHDWLNQALVEVVNMKPNAKTMVAQLPLVAGTLQTLPAEYTRLSRVLRNVGAGGGRAVRVLFRRETLDHQLPGWQDSSVLPNCKTVNMVYQDLAESRHFWVIPGNDGTGKVEAIVCAMPNPVPRPSGDVTAVESYDTEVDLPDIYQTALLDLVLFRAFSKDGIAPEAAGRASAHYEKASAAIQALIAGDAALSLVGGSAPQA